MENNEEQELQPDTNAEEVEQDGAEDTRDWKAEALKYKAIADRKEKKLQELPKEAENKTNETSNLSLERLELKIDGYSKDEIDLIMENGGINALQNPLIKKGLEVMRQENANKAKYLEASGSGSTRKSKEKSPDDMSEEERADLYAKTVAGG